MRTHLRSVALLLPLCLTACFHRPHSVKTPPLAPPLPDATQTQPQPQTQPAQTTPSDATPPAPATTAQPAPEKQPEKPVHHTVHHKKPAAKPAEEASSAPSAPSGVSAIGQLSPGDTSDLSRETVTSIDATERGLKQINRGLTTQEQKTVAQIKEFLKQAKAALASGDVDGAHTLAMKAKVLLGEISR